MARSWPTWTREEVTADPTTPAAAPNRSVRARITTPRKKSSSAIGAPTTTSAAKSANGAVRPALSVRSGGGTQLGVEVVDDQARGT